MSITPVTRREVFMNNAASGDSSLTPVTREEVFLNKIADAVSTGGGGGESNAVKYTAQSLTADQKAQARTNIGAGTADAPTVDDVTGATPSITAEGNHIYKCGEVTSLTVTASADIAFTVVFTSGASATVLTMDENVIMPSGFSVEANTRYEINVADGYAVVAGWEVSADA